MNKIKKVGRYDLWLPLPKTEALKDCNYLSIGASDSNGQHLGIDVTLNHYNYIMEKLSKFDDSVSKRYGGFNSISNNHFFEGDKVNSEISIISVNFNKYFIGNKNELTPLSNFFYSEYDLICEQYSKVVMFIVDDKLGQMMLKPGDLLPVSMEEILAAEKRMFDRMQFEYENYIYENKL